MKRLFKGLLLIGALAGAAVAIKTYLQRPDAPGEESVQIVFDDGSTFSLDPNSVEGQEFTDISRKVLEIGV